MQAHSRHLLFFMTPQSVSTFLLTPKLKWATFLKLAKLNGSKT